MKNEVEFIKEMQPALEKLEGFRKSKASMRRGMNWANLAAVVLLLVSFVAAATLQTWAYFTFVISFFASLLLRNKNHQLEREYAEFYKKNIVDVFVKKLYPNIEYIPEHFMLPATLKMSGLLEYVNQFSGEDFFKGQTKNGYHFSFSELKRKRIAEELREQSAEHYRQIFIAIDSKGLYFDPILLIPKAIHKTIGKKIHKKLFSTIKEGALIDLDDLHPEFENSYNIKAVSENQAKAILSFELLDAIHRINDRFNILVELSFIKDQIYIVLPCHKDFFEANIDNSVLQNEFAKEFYQELAYCFGIIETMTEQLQKIAEVKTKIELKQPDFNWKDDAYNHFLNPGDQA